VTEGSPRARRPERELLEAVADVLRGRGYRTFLNPDGTDYFDLAVLRGTEVGLLEGKVGGASEVLTQALVRRAWADWVAVVLGSERSAARLVERTAGRRAEFVGVWSCASGRPRELRAARPTPAAEPEDPYAGTRGELRSALEALDRGEVPDAVRWSGVLTEVRRTSGGRRYREWRLDEPGR
jgi:hypothetical protein